MTTHIRYIIIGIKPDVAIPVTWNSFYRHCPNTLGIYHAPNKLFSYESNDVISKNNFTVLKEVVVCFDNYI